MANDFDGSGDGRYTSDAPASATPLTLSCWVKLDAIGSTKQTCIAVVDVNSDDNYFELSIDSNGKPTAGVESASLRTGAISSQALNTGVWYHLLAEFTSNSARKIYVNGVEKGSDSTTVTPAGLDTTSWGFRKSSTSSKYLDGSLFYCAIHETTLSATEISQMAGTATGIWANTPRNPHDIQRGKLVSWLPMYGTNDHELCAWNKNDTEGDITDAGSPTQNTALPSDVDSYLYTWPMLSTNEVPATVGVHYGITFTKKTSAGATPVIDTEPDTPEGGGGQERTALHIEADGDGVHSEYNIVTAETGLEDGFHCAFDLAQHIGRDYIRQGRCTSTADPGLPNRNYIGRFLKLARSGNATGGLDAGWQARHEFDELSGSDHWYFSTARYDTSVTNNWDVTFDATDYIGTDGTRRLRCLITYRIKSGSQYVDLYVEKEDGTRRKIVSGEVVTFPNDSCNGMTLRARCLSDDQMVDPAVDECARLLEANGDDYLDTPNDNDPHHQIWISNVAIGTDIDDVWDYSGNLSGGANNPDDTP